MCGAIATFFAKKNCMDSELVAVINQLQFASFHTLSIFSICVDVYMDLFDHMFIFAAKKKKIE